VSIFNKLATPYLGVRWGFETTSRVKPAEKMSRFGGLFTPGHKEDIE
jgi:hypothetical protein